MSRSSLFVALLLLAGNGSGQNLSLSSKDARRGPEGLNRETIYQVWMRAFTPEGTLNATAAKLPYVANLGAGIVYLSPLQEHSLAGGAAKGWTLGGPYGVKDYARIDPGYGTEEDLKALTAQAHKLKLKVIMDVVFYHMAVDNELMKIPGFYMRDGEGKAILGNWGRPRPDFANPKLREYLVGNLVHWVRDAGLDGFRCDVAAGVPLSFWEEARQALDAVNRDAILLAEAEMPEQQLKAFDISYNFSYLKQTLQQVLEDGEPASRIRENWEKQKAVWPRGSRLIYGSDNHDQDRATRLFGEKAAYAASVLNFTMDGIPFLYNGQEIADTTPTSYPERRPIHWELQKEATLAKYRNLFAMRKQEAALTSGELTWLNNSAPDSLVTFLRKKEEDDQVLVIVNLSNRKVAVTVDLAAADFMPATDLLTSKKVSTAFSPGHVSFPAPLEAYGTMVLKRLPRQVMAGKP